MIQTEPKYSDTILSQCDFVYNKYHKVSPKIVPCFTIKRQRINASAISHSEVVLMLLISN